MARELLCMSIPRPYLFINKLTTAINPPVISTFRRTLSCSPATGRSSMAQSSHLIAERGSADYQPTTWTFDFVQSLDKHHLVEIHEDEVIKLEEEVKIYMVNGDDDDEDGEMLMIKKLELVDDIQRLGLGYRFEEDVRKALDDIQGLININARFTEKSLHTAALCFRLLRQHGYEVSQDIFKSFKDENGSFKECLCDDVKGMLSLYEASYLSFEGEELMDGAKAFTITYLQNQRDQNATNNISLAEHVSHALELPLHHTMQRQEARWYINAYSKRSDANQLLLQLAKVDFNMVQSTLQTDLKDMSSWWKGLGLANKLSFTRDRLMECFFWAVGMVSEPQFSNLRKGLTKVASFITVIDDVYDVYGTLDELELFTNAVERWDVNAVKILPDYMKLCFLALYNTVNEMAYDTLKEQGQNILPYLTKAWADMCKAFLKEAKWSHSKHTPTFEEYLENGWISVSGVLLLVHSYFLLSDNIITMQGIECLQNYHNLLRCPSIIFRLSNDLGTSKAEIQRGETANSITCSMRENDISEECARRNIHNLMEETWKKMNKEIRAGVDSSLPKTFVDTALNLARISRCTYQYGDGHGAPDQRSKNRVLSLLIDPIQ